MWRVVSSSPTWHAERVSARAARFAFLLAALCPFTANYTVAPLAETLSIFFTAVALDCAVAAFQASEKGVARWSAWISCGIAVSAGILLRPDGGILLVALGLFLLWRMWQRPCRTGTPVLGGSGGAGGFGCAAGALDGPKLARLPSLRAAGARVTPAIRTSLFRLVSTSGCEPGRSITFRPKRCTGRFPATMFDFGLLPSRAFDSVEEREKTQAIFNDYAKTHFVGPELNDRFAELANERIKRHRFRYYVWLPTLRIADMWLRPRTEMLPLNTRWWEYDDDTQGCVLATLWGVLNLLFLFAAVMGLVRGPRPQYLALMLLFVLLRSAFLGTLENPEPRYTLECFPVVLVLGGAWLSGIRRLESRRNPAKSG